MYLRRRKRGGGGGARCACALPPLFWLGGNGMFVPPPPTLSTPHFYFPLELYVYITLTNNYLAFFIYQLIILWIISINWHRWLLLNNYISKYSSFILVLYRVCVPPPPTFLHLPTPLYIYIYISCSVFIFISLISKIRGTSICMYVLIYECMYACMDTYIWMYAGTYVYILLVYYVCIHLCMLYVCMYLCINVCTCACSDIMKGNGLLFPISSKGFFKSSIPDLIVYQLSSTGWNEKYIIGCTKRDRSDHPAHPSSANPLQSYVLHPCIYLR